MMLSLIRSCRENGLKLCKFLVNVGFLVWNDLILPDVSDIMELVEQVKMVGLKQSSSNI